jgi:hypothetical protein
MSAAYASEAGQDGRQACCSYRSFGRNLGDRILCERAQNTLKWNEEERLNWPFTVHRGRREDRPGFASRGSGVRVPLAPLPRNRRSAAVFLASGLIFTRRFPPPCPLRARSASAPRPSCPAWLPFQLPGRQVAKRVGDLPLPLVGRVQVDQRRPRLWTAPGPEIYRVLCTSCFLHCLCAELHRMTIRH